MSADQAARCNRLTDNDFKRLAEFVHEYCGIKMPPTKMTMVEGRLRRRLRALNMATYEEYCHYVFHDGGIAEEAVHLIDAITTNKTDFFREKEHFDFLTATALPALATRQRRGRAPIKLWSTACSIGAEPYTLAMVMAEFAAANAQVTFSILATDICTDVLGKAVKAIYPEEMMAPIPNEMRRRYLMRSRDAARHEFRIVPELRRQVKFARLNLMEGSYPVDTDMDVIFCRNLLIYFDKSTQQAVLARLCDHLQAGSYLFIGHSETITGFSLPVRPVAPTVFQRL